MNLTLDGCSGTLVTAFCRRKKGKGERVRSLFHVDYEYLPCNNTESQ